MRTWMTTTALACAAMVCLPATGEAQDFEWNGRIDSGDKIEIKGDLESTGVEWEVAEP